MQASDKNQVLMSSQQVITIVQQSMSKTLTRTRQKNLLCDKAVATLHERSYCSWSGIELGHLVFIGHNPVTTRVWIEWSPLKLSNNQIPSIYLNRCLSPYEETGGASKVNLLCGQLFQHTGPMRVIVVRHLRKH